MTQGNDAIRYNGEAPFKLESAQQISQKIKCNISQVRSLSLTHKHVICVVVTAAKPFCAAVHQVVILESSNRNVHETLKYYND